MAVGCQRRLAVIDWQLTVLVRSATVLAPLAALALGACRRVDGAGEPQQSTPEAASRTKQEGSAELANGRPAASSPGWQRLFVDDTHFAPVPPPSPGDWLAEHEEPGQSFEQFVAERPNRPDAVRRFIYLQPLGAFDPRHSPDTALLRDYAARFFSLPTKLLPELSWEGMSITERENPFTHHRQLLTTDILDQLRHRLSKDAYCLLGLTMQDLYPRDDWNFVFGQARLRERVGVYSFVRYAPDFYGDAAGPNARQLVLKRSLKVMVHEIGHMFGLHHCVQHHCLLNGSNHLAESDARPAHACPVCLRKLHHSIGFDPVKRYRRLLDFYQKHGFAGESAWVRARLSLTTAGGQSR